MTTKQCSVCDEDKPLSDFWKKGRKLCSACKPCTAARNKEWRDSNKDKLRDIAYKNKFGISLEEYEAKLETQNNCCAVCGVSQDKVSMRFAVDHNHTTGAVRGLLCGQCNVAIGMAKEDIAILASMISYLMEYEGHD